MLTDNAINHRRSYFDIMAQILSSCHPNATKTTLILRCNMSFPQLTDYLTIMLGAELLQVENNGPTLLFRVTEKGRDFLKMYGYLKTLIE